ncbi:hypothetical protein [Nocardia seriolae]|uniref:hypothetical protein n=1 Tax=Nocardia seriolae TaxID=37332 RepID=UPI0008FF360B|nr:hypothetical protein [Nocardia seriolae]OJF81946.1 hypothetical protein NS14008_25730 [Nocardia seriolae]QOW33967.1 hypothetical protein IMZ23_02120 [Nocardia seriolae]QUN18536.1 hypothetical protein KEC46_03610 [Nocardia seriolae]WNJ61180.1 hypothetical protein RMO66_11050 [Nocardia seriolae]
MVEIAVLRALPAPDQLRRRSRVLALLDCVLGGMAPAHPTRTYRYVEDRRPGESLASMDNGAGDEYSIVFSSAGTYVRGFDHYSELNTYGQSDTGELWPGLTDGLPAPFHPYVTDAAFRFDEEPTMTVCLWRLSTDSGWQTGQTVQLDEEDLNGDGSDWLFDQLIDWSAEPKADHYRRYFDLPADPDHAALHAIMEGAPITADLVHRLNPHIDLAIVTEEAAISGIPVSF